MEVFDFLSESFSQNLLILRNATNTKTKELFFRKIKCSPTGFSGDFLERVYEVLFVKGINMFDEYQQMYSTEYPSFSDFLYFHYTIPREASDYLASAVGEGRVLFFCKVSLVDSYRMSQVFEKGDDCPDIWSHLENFLKDM